VLRHATARSVSTRPSAASVTTPSAASSPAASVSSVRESCSAATAIGATTTRRSARPRPAASDEQRPVPVPGYADLRVDEVVALVDPTGTGPNPRFFVTDLATAAGWTPHAVHRFYCARGDRENRIKEFKLDMHGERLSCTSFLANQFRLLLHAAAYLLYQALQREVRRAAPEGELAHAQVETLRSRFMKVAARVLERCRVVRVHLCSSFPQRALWQAVARRLLAPVT